MFLIIFTSFEVGIFVYIFSMSNEQSFVFSSISAFKRDCAKLWEFWTLNELVPCSIKYLCVYLFCIRDFYSNQLSVVGVCLVCAVLLTCVFGWCSRIHIDALPFVICIYYFVAFCCCLLVTSRGNFVKLLLEMNSSILLL